ncbi:MAG: T9SS type A sorting domain-containing protein [Saprospirales bacterium]|nr:T9SS type A sorting domain-containing protein [Saprospirales bacterium]
MQPRGLATPPVLLIDWIGNTSSSGTPLDNHLAVSNGNQIVSVINRHVAIKDPLGDWIGAATLNNFFLTLGLNAGKYDPRVLYDPDQDRFILFALAGTNSSESYVVVGFSQTNDADADWNLYKIPGALFGNGTWTDFPMIALSDKEVFLTSNSIQNGQSWQAGFYETLIWQIDKVKGYNGEPLAVKMWSEIEFGGKPIRNLCPVKSAIGEPNDRMFFLSNRNFDIQNDTIFILELNGTQDDPNVSLDMEVRKTNQAYGVPPSAVQPLDSLATNDGRILDAFWIDDQIQFVGNCIDTASGQAAIYHGIIDNLSSTRDVSGYVVTGGPDDIGYPSIAYVGTEEGDQDAIIVVSHTSAVRFPGCSALYFDNDRQHSELVTIKEGLNSINMQANVTLERWGDYSGNQRKYDQPGVVWCASSYGKSNKDNDTWIASLASPKYFASTGNQKLEPREVDVFPVPTSDRVFLEFEARGVQYIRIQLIDLNGNVVQTFLEDKPQQEGKAKFSFSTAPLANGLYVLTIQGDGQILASEKVVVNR